ncbi:MAG TPA: chorismate mutase [Gemmatimonadaceae bacterium]|jgi:chorismate mutase|nr:chorismate mutase [Gemmatimonadaceae bacterium]HTD61116.1 chorismate mutase [Gemmatimonadaceae bacterium]
MMRLRAIRGAITVERDAPELVYAATRELLSEIIARNAVDLDHIISVIFTVTPDLTSAFPAMAARSMGWLDVPLLCTMEIPVPGAMAHCIRVLLHVESDRQRSAIQHVYLGDAQSLRPDISEVRPAPESRPPRQG